MNEIPTPLQGDVTGIRSWAERHGFSDWALALIWMVLAFLLFQVTAGVVAAILLITQTGAQLDAAEATEMVFQNLDLVFIGNSAGQILFLGLATVFIAKLHTGSDSRSSFLRFKIRKDTARLIGLTAVLIIAVQPLIWFFSWLNSLLPVPQLFENLQNTQMDMIEQYLKGDHSVSFTLFHIAVVPAICEEIMFRGYLMRTFQKSWGVWAAILISGLLFGMYHIQLTNLIPLAAIGILLAFLTWVSESLYPAIVAHFINNGGSVFVGTYYPESALAEMTPETMPPLGWVLLSLVVSALLIYWMYTKRTAKPMEELPDV